MEIEEFLKNHHIEYKKHEHPAVFTCEEAEKHCLNIPGIATKNLFLRDDKKKRYFLVVLPAKKQVEIKKIAEAIGVKKISFASPNDLESKLGLKPGSVSPFGLINNQDRSVEIYIDKDVNNAEIVTFHPNVNTATLELTQDNFNKFLDAAGHNVQVLNF